MPTSPSKNNSKSSEKELKIIEAATEIFFQHGFSAATTDMIQKHARVSKATLYAFFANKEVLFAQVIERQCGQMQSLVNELELHVTKIEETLKNLGLIYLSFVMSPMGLALYRICIAEAARFPDLSHIFYKAGPYKTVQAVTQNLARAVQRQEVSMPPFGLETAAIMFLSLLRSDMHIEYLTHPDAQPSAAQLEKWTDTVVKLFLNGILKA